MLWDLINREKLRRALLYLLYMLLCLLAQDSIFANLRLFGVNMLFLPAASWPSACLRTASGARCSAW